MEQNPMVEQKIYNFLLRKLGDKELCHDLFQDVFLHVHCTRHEFDLQRSFATWIFTIANNRVKNEFKRLSRLKIRLGDLSEASAAAGNNRNLDYEDETITRCDQDVKHSKKR